MDVRTSAGLKSPSARRSSGDQITDVDITPYFSSRKSAFQTKHSIKSVNNQEEAGGIKDDRQPAPIMHEDFKPVKLRTHGWHRKHKVSMKQFIMRRAVRKNDLELPNNSGMSQGNVDVSSLIRQAVKRGRDVALKQAKMATAHKPPETTIEDMKKLSEMAMLWKRNNRDPSHKVKTSRVRGTSFNKPFSETKEHSIGSDPMETYQPLQEKIVAMDTLAFKSTGTDSKLNLQPTGSSASAEPQDVPEEEDTAEETTNYKSTRNDKEEPLPHEQPEVPEQDEYSQHGGTSSIPEVDMNVHPKMRALSGLRWNVALERRDTSDNGKEKSHKKKKKPKHQSSTQDPADDGSPIIVGGIIGGLFILMAIVTCFIQLW